MPNAGEQGQISNWMNKEKMTENADLFGLMTPKTWILKSDECIQKIEYPCITKSITSVKVGKTDFTICHNVDELSAFLANQNNSQNIQVQKLIEKNFEFQFIGCSLDRGNEIIIPGMSYIENVHSFNNLAFLKYGSIDSSFNELLEKCNNYIRNIGYSGLFSIEFIKGKDEKDYFLEINFRNDGNAISVTESGTNLPYIWYLFNIGGDYKTEIAKSTIRDIYCVPEDSYFLDMINGKITFREWRSNMHKANCYITYFKDDKRPFYALIRLQSKVFIKSTIKRILRELHLTH